VIKQQINFFDQLAHEKTELFQLKQMIYIVLIFVFFLTSYGSFSDWLIQRTLKVEHEITLNQKATNSKVASLKKDYAEELSGDFLSKQIEDIKKSLAAKEEIISILSNQEDNVNREGFSDYFVALSDNTISNVWLTSVRIDQNKGLVSLSGKSSGNNLVFAYLKLLNSTRVFSTQLLKLDGLLKESSDNSFAFYGKKVGRR
jgi:hypothetical protein